MHKCLLVFNCINCIIVMIGDHLNIGRYKLMLFLSANIRSFRRFSFKTMNIKLMKVWRKNWKGNSYYGQNNLIKATLENRSATFPTCVLADWRQSSIVHFCSLHFSWKFSNYSEPKLWQSASQFGEWSYCLSYIFFSR